MAERTIRVVRVGPIRSMPIETAVSDALLAEVSAGRIGETIRLFIPRRSVAFGKQDVASPGFTDAVAAARSLGFEPFIRLSGGRAAVFHEGTVGLSWAIPDPDPIDGIRRRFTAVAGLVVQSLADLGIEAAVGVVPGEYCPGSFSISVAGAKVAGIGQRLARAGAHVGAVIVVRDAGAIRRVLVPVYERLGLEWNPSTAGALADTEPSVEPGAVIDAIVARFRRDGEIVEGSLPRDLVATAAERAAAYAPA